MKATRLVALVVGGSIAVSALALAQSESAAALQDIQKTFGFVPAFFKAMPDSAIAGAWDEMKNVQMNPNTALPARTKDLIGLAVAAQIPCRYCVYFHTKAAKAEGASDQDLKEAVAMSGMARHWATIISGAQIEYPQFKQEVGQMFQHAGQTNGQTKTGQQPPATQPPASQPAPASPGDHAGATITDAQSAYDDIRRTLGTVPSYLKFVPEEGVAGAWRESRDFEMSPHTSLDNKTKMLIGLAVSAQIPCNQCVYYATESARKNGASDREIREAVTVAAMARNWSTVINGSQIDENAFRRDVDRIFKNAEKANKQARTEPAR